jgi:hypothetical protein
MTDPTWDVRVVEKHKKEKRKKKGAGVGGVAQMFGAVLFFSCF